MKLKYVFLLLVDYYINSTVIIIYSYTLPESCFERYLFTVDSKQIEFPLTSFPANIHHFRLIFLCAT